MIFARSRRCNHCGYAYCHSCSDYQALMPRTGNETGYDAMNVCAYCIEYLTITAAGRTALKALSLSKLRNYINAYGIKTDRVVEKDDLIDAILNARAANGCLGHANETYYRRFSVPNRAAGGRTRGLFSRPGQSSSTLPQPPPRPATAPRPEFARPDLAPDDPPPTHAYSNPPYVPRNPPPRPPPQQQYHPPPHPPPQQQYNPPPQAQYYNPPPAGYPPGGPHGYYGTPQNSYPQYQQHYNPQYPPPPPPPHSRPQPPPPNANTRPQPPPRPTSASGRPTQASSSYMQPPSPPPRPRATSSTYSRPSAPQPPPAASRPPPTLDSLLQMSPEEIRALSIGNLKAILFTNHVNAGQILEKGDLVSKVLVLVEDEKAERERARRAEELEEMERVQRDQERQEEARQERERRERSESEAQENATSSASASANDSSGEVRPQEDGRDDDHMPAQEPPPAPPSSPPKPAVVPPLPRSHAERTGLCVVCQDEEANIAIVDCGHMSMCRGCSDLIMASSRECPLCRTRIVTEARLLRIFKT
ncbi:unnamed protein product [Cyclocybe aegerita]|uniref:RING-type domain-containing protein n=1 Tax=Cyclocybe aegerita TaxID=1973307 RepID=A0A8S0XZQ9_CYCAE|nr:unnamed protein product [Cyclocybe aegerita]